MGAQAFDGKRGQLFFLDPEDIIVIGLDTDDGPEHDLYDERVKLPLSEKLVLNIMALQKVLEPVSVRKNGDKAECVYGRQRVRCTREANKRLRKQGCEPVLVPCQLERGESDRMLGMMISENEHREGDTPMVKARKLARYIGHGRTDDEAAAIFGVTTQTVRNMLALLDLDKSVQKMVESGALSPTAAGKLAALSRDEQKIEAEKMVAEGTVTVAAAARAVRSKRNGDDGGPVAPSKRALRRAIERNASDEVLSADVVRGIRIAIGDLSPATVKGLTELLVK
jgi:ParB family chromosome partitioning protein